jgi:multicomponent Na+:H+ antiporter subunit E
MRLYHLFVLLFFFIIDLIVSNIKILLLALSFKSNWNPGYETIELPKSMTSIQRMVFAHMVSATPGSVSVDISSDKRFLLIHILSRDENTATDLKNLQSKLIKRVCHAF